MHKQFFETQLCISCHETSPTHQTKYSRISWQGKTSGSQTVFFQVVRKQLSCHIQKDLLIHFCVNSFVCHANVANSFTCYINLKYIWATYVLLKPGVYTPTLKNHQVVRNLKKFENHCTKPDAKLFGAAHMLFFMILKWYFKWITFLTFLYYSFHNHLPQAFALDQRFAALEVHEKKTVTFFNYLGTIDHKANTNICNICNCYATAQIKVYVM